MRKFKRCERNLALLGPAAVVGVNLDRQPRNAIAQLRPLRGERVLTDLFEQAQVEQLILLLAQQRELPIQLGKLLLARLLLTSRALAQHPREPMARLLVLDAQLVEERQHLLVENLFLEAYARMPRRGVAGAAVVTVGLGSARPLLLNDLAGDQPSAMATGDEAARVGQLVRAVDLPAQEVLHAIERHAVDQRLVLARIPLAPVSDLA